MSRVTRVCSCVSFIAVIGFEVWGALAQCDPISGASGPDAVPAFSSGLQLAKYGCIDGVVAYSGSGGICNIGTEGLPGDISSSHHPMLTSNLYRLGSNRFEQIGLSWVKHDDWTSAFPNSSCGSALSCTPCEYAVPECCDTPHSPSNPDCETEVPRNLGVGCSDIYSTCNNGYQGWLGPRSQINASTGAWPVGGSATFCGATSRIDCRLQVKVVDLAATSSQYFFETQVVTPDETSTATRNNNVSYKTITVDDCDEDECDLEIANNCGSVQACSGTGCSCIHPLTASYTYYCQEPAIKAWIKADASVVETEFQALDEYDDPTDGKFILAAKAWNVSGCVYQYEYALYNMNSDRAADGFSVPLPSGLSSTELSAIAGSAGFHDINYHSGEPYDLDPEHPEYNDWTPTVTSGSISWATPSYSPSENANALRWGTLYNFRFQAPRPPSYSTTVTIDLFKSGTPTSLIGTSVGPAGTTVGSCCVSSTCTVTSQACCDAQSGSYWNPGKDCTDCDENGTADICESFGKCCLYDETCIHTRNSACCIAAGGFYWFGLGTNCHT